VDAFRNSGGLFTDAYLKKVDAVCVQHSNKMAAIPNFYGDGSVKGADARVTSYDRAVQGFMRDFNAVKAPKKWRSFKTATARDLAAVELALAQFATAVTPKSSVASVLAAETRYRADVKGPGKRFDKRVNGQGLFRCGSDF
jgi:hypothetical protein